MTDQIQHLAHRVALNPSDESAKRALCLALLRQGFGQRAQLTLTTLIARLASAPDHLPVYGLTPKSERWPIFELCSYRGYYDQLGIGPTGFERDGAQTLCVKDVLSLLRAATGQEFQGYKGGEYTMREHTPVWLAEYGESSGLAICDVLASDSEVFLISFESEGEPTPEAWVDLGVQLAQASAGRHAR